MNYTANESVLVGLTGGIATGKSTVIQYLRENGYSVIDADKLGHRVLEPGSYGYQQIVETFGIEIINPDSKNMIQDCLNVLNDSSLKEFNINQSKVINPLYF